MNSATAGQPGFRLSALRSFKGIQTSSGCFPATHSPLDIFLVLLRKVVVRHSSDVIANHAVGGFLFGLGKLKGGQTAGMVHVKLERLRHASHNSFTLGVDFPVGIKIVVEKNFQRLVLSRYPRAGAHHA